MPNYDWKDYREADLRGRFPAALDILGLDEWLDFVMQLLELNPWSDADDPDRYVRLAAVLDNFMSGVRSIRPAPASKPKRVFVSHSHRDTPKAVRIAGLIAAERMPGSSSHWSYWLDVHDPPLAVVNRGRLPSPARQMLIAAIVEIALLNCSHVIALHTDRSRGSRWIPYEFGRCRAHRVATDQACNWFASRTLGASAPEYTLLAAHAYNNRDIRAWLGRQ